MTQTNDANKNDAKKWHITHGEENMTHPKKTSKTFETDETAKTFFTDQNA